MGFFLLLVVLVSSTWAQPSVEVAPVFQPAKAGFRTGAAKD